MARLVPEISIPAALATATIVYTIQGRMMAPQLDIRAGGTPGDEMVDSVRKQNAWLAAATVAGISLIARDPVVFIVGGSMVVAFDWLTRINMWTAPEMNRVDRGGAGAAPAEAITPDVSHLSYDVASSVN